MTRYIGLDVHKRFVEYCILDAAGKKLSRGQVPCVRTTLETFATTILQPTDHIALEASTNTRASAHEIGGLSSLARYDLSCYNFF